MSYQLGLQRAQKYEQRADQNYGVLTSELETKLNQDDTM